MHDTPNFPKLPRLPKAGRGVWIPAPEAEQLHAPLLTHLHWRAQHGLSEPVTSETPVLLTEDHKAFNLMMLAHLHRRAALTDVQRVLRKYRDPFGELQGNARTHPQARLTRVNAGPADISALRAARAARINANRVALTQDITEPDGAALRAQLGVTLDWVRRTLRGARQITHLHLPGECTLTYDPTGPYLITGPQERLSTFNTLLLLAPDSHTEGRPGDLGTRLEAATALRTLLPGTCFVQRRRHRQTVTHLVIWTPGSDGALQVPAPAYQPGTVTLAYHPPARVPVPRGSFLPAAAGQADQLHMQMQRRTPR